MACRWVTFLRARRTRKVYGLSETYDFVDQSCARMFLVVYGYGYGYGRPAETLLQSNVSLFSSSSCIFTVDGVMLYPLWPRNFAYRLRQFGRSK
jgi:hypothetical protein